MSTEWTWEKEEAPEKEAFEDAYEKIMKRARKGQVSIREAYWFHQTENRFSCKYPSVLKAVTESGHFWRRELLLLVQFGVVTEEELPHIMFLCGGMKHFEFFKELHHVAMITKYPTTWAEEERKEQEAVKKTKVLYYKRLAS